MWEIISFLVSFAIVFVLIKLTIKRHVLNLEIKLHEFLADEIDRLAEENKGMYDELEKTPGYEKVYKLLNDSNKFGYKLGALDLHSSVFEFFKKKRTCD